MRKTKHIRTKNKRIWISVTIDKCRVTKSKLWPLAVWSYCIDGNYLLTSSGGRGYCAHWLVVADFRVEVTS